MIKSAYYAGSFYPEKKENLIDAIKGYLEEADVDFADVGKLKALIVPHAGYIYSGPVAAYGFKLLTKVKYNNIMLAGPSHKVYFKGIAYADYEYWQTPLGEVKVDNTLIKRNPIFIESIDAVVKEHSIEVQIPFIQTVMKDITITPLVTGDISNYNDYISILISISRNSLIIISSDLSHYLTYNEAVKTDEGTIKQILSLEQIDHEQACGADGINLLSAIAEKAHWVPKLLDYRNSGDTSGHMGEVVGYCAIGYYSHI